MPTKRLRCINCNRRRRKQMVLVQICVPSEDEGDKGEEAYEHAESISICRPCLADPVVAMTLAAQIREAA